jgi:hypothetical protein
MIRRCLLCSLSFLLMTGCNGNFAATATPEMLPSGECNTFMMLQAVQIRMDLISRGITTDFIHAFGPCDATTVTLVEIGIQVDEDDDLDLMGGWIAQIVAVTAPWPDTMIHLSFMVRARERSRLEFQRRDVQTLIEQGLIGTDLLTTVSGEE